MKKLSLFLSVAVLMGSQMTYAANSGCSAKQAFRQLTQAVPIIDSRSTLDELRPTFLLKAPGEPRDQISLEMHVVEVNADPTLPGLGVDYVVTLDSACKMIGHNRILVTWSEGSE